MEIITLILHYLLPLVLLVVLLELWLTKQRAKRFQQALENIANDPFAVDYDGVRAQRDRCMNIAKHTLHIEPNLPKSG